MGIRALKQNASEVMARVKKGAQIVVTDRGRPIGRIVPVAEDRMSELEEAGLLSTPTTSLTDLLARAAHLPPAAIPSEDLLDESRQERL